MPTRPPRATIARVQGAQPAPSRRATPVSVKRLYSTPEWRQARAAYLAAHPWCECPEHKGSPTAPRASYLDHVIPHKGDMRLFWDQSNWQALSHSCHSRKTATQDGGFGNARRHGGT